MVDVPSRGYQPIENYGIIGDLYTVALVGMDGSIDFMACPHFDSPTVFAALLDSKKGGRFQIAPQLADARQKQLYLPDANILLTRFLSSEGMAEISDFMRRRLSQYAYPRKVEFVDDLPKTLTGKIRRIELREREQQLAHAPPR